MRITVKKYMTQKATPEFDFMARWNNNVPMPLRTMVGTVERETKGMVYMKLHGDIYAERVTVCMKCGRVLTNPVSQFFGLGPECGGHNYVNPFDTEEELHAAVDTFRKQLQDITWEGWIIKSAITEQVNDDTDVAVAETKKAEEPKKKIRMEIKKADKCNGDVAVFVSFPYDTEILDRVRAYTTRYWHADIKAWELPYKALKSLTDDFTAYDVEIIGDKPSEEKPAAETPSDFEFKTKPFVHQIDGFNFGLNHDRWLLGDEQGLGKTKQVIDIAVAKKLQEGYKHCLIICGVNGLKWNWVNEVATHSNERAWILGQRIKNHKLVVGSTEDKKHDILDLIHNQNPSIDECYFIIANVEALRNDDIAKGLQKLCSDKVIGVVAIDEIHKCKNPSSQQGKGILKIQSECRIAMTGTPLMNNPMDLYIILKWLGVEKHSFYQFRNHYCVMGGFGGYEIIGYRYLSELQDTLKDIMLRRLKSEVLDLPEKTHVTEYVDMTDKQAQIYKEITADIRAHIDEIKMSNNPLAELIRMRQATGFTGILSSTIRESAKLDRMEELVEEAVASGKKVVVFSNWTQMTDEIYNRLHTYHPAIITGQTDADTRQDEVWHFQNDDKCKVIIGTIGAMGTGLTLTAGTVEIFVDEPWNMALKEQAEDRCHRVGTTENVTIYTLICKNTIDERINELVERKGIMADALVDGKVAKNKGALVEYLIG